MIRKIFVITYALCCLLFCATAANAQDGVNVDADNIQTLIKTLESETARNEFIANLKTLQDNANEGDDRQGTHAPLLSETLGLDAQAEELLGDYNAFLRANNLNSSVMGQIGMTFAALCVAIILGVLVRKACIALRDKLLRVQRRYGSHHNRFRVYARSLRYSGYVLIIALLLYTCATIWDLADFGFVKNETLLSLLSNFFSFFAMSLIAVTIWEAVNVALEHYMGRSTISNSSRLKTLLPIIKNVLFVTFALLFALVALSEIGIDIMPLLAGAGVFGIAIGFGAQTMVRDFITGFIIILEDLVQVNDVVKIAGRVGLVEHISIRKIQLRGLDGTVYTVPFSEIDIVENLTKDFSYYLMDIGIAYREDPDEVIVYLKDIATEMRAEEAWRTLILDDIEILGVDKFADSAVIIKARIKTRPAQQWSVGREYNRRMKYKFDKHNVEIPFPHQTIYFGEDKNGKAPPAYLDIKGADSVDRTALSPQSDVPATEGK